MAMGILVVPTETALIEVPGPQPGEETDADPDRHRQEDPQGQVAIQG